MKKSIILLLGLSICLCTGATNVSGVIAANTNWTLANAPYVVTGSVTVNAGITLNIESGVEVRFASGTNLVIKGALNATNVTFTSNVSTTAGAWGALYFDAGSTANLSNVNVQYATEALRIRGVCVLNLSDMIFTNNTNQRVYTDNITFNTNMTLPKMPIPYYTLNWFVSNGAVLTIAAGNIVKFAVSGDAGIYVDNGSLQAIGTASEPIVFTSARDNFDGGWVQDATVPTANVWRHIRFNSGDSTSNHLEYCQLRYGGHYYGGTGRGSVEVNNGAGVTIKNCILEKSQRALFVNSGGAVNLKNSTLNGTDYPFAMRADGVLDVTNSDIDFTGTQYQAILLLGNSEMSANGHLKIIPFNNAPNMAYANDDWIRIPAGLTLTIDPGVVIKGFNTNGRIGARGGKLIAEGTVDNPIIFTSIYDDNYGNPSDSNNDGVATSPTLGQWGGIALFSDANAASSLKYCNFGYVNWPHSESFLSEAVYSNAVVSIYDISPTVENCTFYECNYGIKTYGTAAPVIRANSFENIKYTPIALNASSHPVLDNNAWGENIKYRALGLLGQKTGSTGKVSKLNDFGNTNLTYLLLDNWIIPNGVNVEIDPGVVIKAMDAVFVYVHGGLKIVGTEMEHITFTERRDDNFGIPADLEGDGNASAPAVNRWGGICYYNDCDNTLSQINYADFRYGGRDGLRGSYTYTSGIDPLTNAGNLQNTSRSGVLTFSRTAVNVQNSTFFTCGHGLAYYGPEAIGSATDVTIEASDNMPIVQTWSAKPNFSNVTLTNNANQGICLQDIKIDYDVTLGKASGIIGSNDNTNAIYLVPNIEFAEGATVQVSQGLIFKSGNSYPHTVKGTLHLNGTSSEHITFTSIHDDSKGGDTNNNGNATSPSASNWGYYYGFLFSNSTGSNSIKYVDMAYARSGMEFVNSTATIEDTRIEYCSEKGVSIEGTSDVTIRRTAFNNMQVPIRKNAFSTCTIHENNTASNVSIMGIELIGETLNTSGTLPIYTFAGYPNITYWLTSTLTVGAGTTFTVPAGASFKRNTDNYLYNCFDVKGTLNIEGTGTASVLMTDMREDSYGSPLDFNQDGTVTQNYGRYDRTFINFNSGSAGTLENLILKSNGYGVYITGASPTLRNVLFDNLGRGVAMTGIGSAPVIENSVFNNTTYPIETSLLCFPASLSGNAFSGTTYKGIKVLAETLNQNATLIPRAFGGMTNAPYIFENYTISAELTIKPGVKCKFIDGKGVTVNRCMKAIGTPDSVIVFTSIRDDFYGGDTNADSTATAATGSHWYGVSFADASIDADCQLKNVIVKNAYEAITTTGASPSLDSVTFYTNRNAVQASGASNPVITNCDFVGQSQRAVNNVNQSFTIQATNCWWGNSAGPVVATAPSGTQQAITAGVNYLPYKTNGLNQPLIGDVSTNGTIQAYDASLVLQAAVNSIALDAQQTLAADASGDNNITAYDATLILEYVAGINSNMPGGLKAPRYANASPSLTIGSGNITHETDLLLPLEIKDIPASVGVDIVLTYNPALLQAIEILPAANTNFMQAVRIDNETGHAYIAAASTNGQTSDAWNVARFRVADNANTDFQTNISSELFRVNEADKTVSAINGTVIFRTPTEFNPLQGNDYLSCFPNPATDIIYLSGVQNGTKVSIYNISGQIVQTTSLADNKINVSSLNNGLYFISVEYNGDVQKVKFLKK